MKGGQEPRPELLLLKELSQGAKSYVELAMALSAEQEAIRQACIVLPSSS